MRHFLLLILLTISHFSFSQKQGQDSNTQQSVKVADTAKKTTNDTAKLLLKDSIVIANKDLSNSDLKLFIQQRARGTEYFKYIFTILTLVLGIGINKLLDYISERKRIKKVGERWVAEIRYLDKPISNQIEALEKFLIEHKKEKFIAPQMNIYSGLDCEIFKSLDKSDLLKFLEKNKKKKYKEAVLSSNKIHGYISILASHYESMKTKFEEYLKGTSSHTTSLTQNLQLLMRAFGTYGVLLEKELDGDPINDPRYRPILDLFNTEIMPHMENGEFDVYKLKSDFFIPLLEILGLLRHDERINELAEYSSNCLNFIKGIQMEKKYLTENFETIKSFYKDELAELENVVKEVE
jgi:hypothetical protein